MENSYRLNTSVHRQRSLDKHKSCKFKHISNPVSTSHTLVNELNYKYDIYQHGTPNVYENDIAKIKAANFRSNINIVDTPQLDEFLNTLTTFKEHPGINKRDYNLHPLPKYQRNKFKELISDKRQISDFIIWIEERLKQVQCKGQSAAKKFHEKQNIIATGFNQTIIQLSKFSKPRAQLLKVLWNKQNQQLSEIIKTITSQKLKEEKKYLESCKDLHIQYQNQIRSLTKEIEEYKLKYQRELLVNKSIVNTLRVQRRRLKRYQLFIKKINDFNFLLKSQNMGLIQENNRLLLNNKNISEQQAQVLTYRIIQLQKQNQKCLKSKLRIKQLKKDINRNSKKAATNQPLIELQQKKQKLYRFLSDRMIRFPNEKLFVRESYFSDEQDGPASIQQYLKSLISAKQIQEQLIAEAAGFNISYADKAVGTQQISVSTLMSQELSAKILTQNKQMQTQTSQISMQSQNCTLPIQNIFQCFEHDEFAQSLRTRARKRRIQLSNYLILLGMQNVGKISKNCLKDSETNNFKQSIISPSIFSSMTEDNEQQQAQEGVFQNLKRVLMKFISSNKKTKQFQNKIQQLNLDGQILQSQYFSRKQTPSNLQKGDERIFKVRDLIFKYTQTHKQPILPMNIQKLLNKTLLNVYKRLYKHPQKNPFVVELFETIKDRQAQNMNYELNKLLIMINTIYQSQQNSSSFIKTLALLLGIGQKHNFHENINQQDVSHFYFKLFNNLTIISPLQQDFRLWKSYTTSSKLKNTEIHEIISNYIHQKRHVYILNSLQEFSLIKPEILSTCESENTFIPIQSIRSIDLHKIILFIIEVYLLEKKNYYDSYSYLFNVLQSNKCLKLQIFLLLLDLFGCSQSLQLQIINQCYKQIKKISLGQSGSKTDNFYRMCVKHNFPYFEQINLTLHQKFKEVPEAFIKQYFPDFSHKNWMKFKQSLDEKFSQKIPNLILRAMIFIVDILQKNSYAVGKQKQEVLCFLYKLLIVKLYGIQIAIQN